MSILNVEHLSHGFGDRAIFTDVSFRLLKGEHIGLIGANGEGKSTFMNIITGKMMPDEGKVEWSKNVRVGYLDQHTVLEKGMTIRDVLKSAFSFLFEMEEKMNDICAKMGDASEDEMNAMMEELGTIQDLLMSHDFYIIDSKVEEIGRAFGLAAPGVGIMAPDRDGGYSPVTGTSFAAPLVTGAAALLMEWGIVRENDPYLYGEKVKAYLRKGARRLPSELAYPNPRLGYGALCVADSLPK